jgi:hypothetical protein
MATLSVRMPDIIKEKANKIAHHQGVSMNNFIICSVSTAISQFDSINFFRKELQGIDRNKISDEFEKIMKKTQKGKCPKIEEIDNIIRNK